MIVYIFFFLTNTDWRRTTWPKYSKFFSCKNYVPRCRWSIADIAPNILATPITLLHASVSYQYYCQLVLLWKCWHAGLHSRLHAVYIPWGLVFLEFPFFLTGFPTNFWRKTWLQQFRDVWLPFSFIRLTLDSLVPCAMFLPVRFGV